MHNLQGPGNSKQTKSGEKDTLYSLYPGMPKRKQQEWGLPWWREPKRSRIELLSRKSGLQGGIEENVDSQEDDLILQVPDQLKWTSPKKGSIIYDWIIQDIHLLKRNSSIKLRSKTFSSSLKFAQWFLQAEVCNEYLVIILRGQKFNSYVTFWANDICLDFPEVKPATKFYGTDQVLRANTDHTLSKPIPLTQITQEAVKIRVSMTLTSNVCQQNSVNRPATIRQCPIDKMNSLLEEKLFWDTEVHVGESVFKVHKVILASVSEVFKKMFENEMQEKKTGVVNITDVDPEVMSDLLSYIYTGSSPNMESHTKELLVAADKYGMDSLVFICMKQLESDLSTETVADIVLVADRIVLGKPLKDACINFVRNEYFSVILSDSWKLLEKNSPELAVEVKKYLPIQFSTSSFHKENISFHWIITDAKSLYQAKAKVQGPEIISKILPCPLQFRLDFTKSHPSVEVAGDNSKSSLLKENHVNVWACGWSFTNLNKPKNQPLTSKCENKPLCRAVSGYYNTYSCSPLSAVLPDPDENFEKYFNDRSLTLVFSGTIVNVKQYSQSIDRIGNDGSDFIQCDGHQFPFDRNQFSDAKILVQKEIFDVHKVILSSVSEVFLQLFQESEQIVEISDVSPDVMSDLLAYIYCGTAPNIKTNTIQILIAADRFHIEDLVSQCLFELQLNFTSENVVEVLLLSHKLYYSALIKYACIDFVKSNYVSVLKSKSWNTLEHTSPFLALEVVTETLEVMATETLETRIIPIQ